MRRRTPLRRAPAGAEAGLRGRPGRGTFFRMTDLGILQDDLHPCTQKSTYCVLRARMPLVMCPPIRGSLKFECRRFGEQGHAALAHRPPAAIIAARMSAMMPHLPPRRTQNMNIDHLDHL